MIIICEACGKKYRIDPGKIRGEQGRFRCRACSFVMNVKKPDVADGPSAGSAPPRPVRLVSSSPVPPSSAGSGPGPGSAAAVALKVPEPQPEPAPAAKKARAGTPARRIRFGLTGKVVSVMLFVSLIPLAAFWAITFQKTNAHLQSSTEQLQERTAIGLADHVDEWIDKNVRVLQTIASLPAAVSMDRRAQEPLLEAVQRQYPWMYLVFTVGPDGMNVARSDGKPLKDYSDRQYYKDVVEGKEIAWQTLIGKTSKKPALVVSVPIKKGDTIVGVMASAMLTDRISDLVANWKQGETGFAFLVDETGKVVAHQVETYVAEERNLADHPLVASFQAGNPGSHTFLDENGEATVGHVTGTRYGWALALQQNETEAFRILSESKRFALTLLGVTVAAVLLISLVSGRAIVTPVRKLTEAADRISIGELDTEIDVRSKDEIGALAEAIGRMQDSIRLSIERLRRRR